MTYFKKDHVKQIAQHYGGDIPGLQQFVQDNIEKDHIIVEHPTELNDPHLKEFEQVTDLGFERIIIAKAGARPVVKILDDKVTTEFLGKNTENSPWRPVLLEASERLNKVIPAVGRIELKNGDAPWVGTGWMIDKGIIVTNAHVAEAFAAADAATASFVFKPGFLGGTVGVQIDFLEEESRTNSIEHPITSVLWISPQGEADVAFLKVEKGNNNFELPVPIDLDDTIKTGDAVVAIGYPSRDTSVKDQTLVSNIFGDDVYDKKRLSPGLIGKVTGERFEHDCSTLRGNSGSMVVNISTGKVVGLHQGGFLNDSANLGVTAAHLNTLLAKVKKRQNERVNTPTEMANPEIKLNIQIPLEITIRAGVPTYPQIDPVIANNGTIDQALDAARKLFSTDTDVIKVRKGYRFKNGWITDEKVVVIEVKEKLEYKDLLDTGKKPFPREIMGIGVDVRTAPLPDQLDHLKINLTALEKKGRPAGYQEPHGFDDPASNMFLKRIKANMDAVFHVSPDEGFKNLSAFIGRTRNQLTATIYEWEVNHISTAIEKAMQGDARQLKMVTQRTGVGERDATISAVEDMKERIGDKFSHVYASTRGKDRLIPDSYHIKVACRDGEELWLSSGNWKESNQPENPTRFSDLSKFNREWHAIIKNPELTALFQRYIDYDFEQATLFPIEIKESLGIADVDLFVPIEAVFGIEKIKDVTYNAELKLTNEFLDIQPLLTPDLDAEGERLFIKAATNMVRRATRSVYVQNQSFSMTADNNEELDEFFDELRKKQRAIGDVRIIFRDARDYKRQADLERQQQIIERLKDFGFDTSPKRMRLQSKCHTKGIIVDAKEVLLGSQNITNGGTLFNRDASLLIRNRQVAEFFQEIFLFDWENLAHNEADERVGGIRIAPQGAPAPEGFVRMTLSELLNVRS